MGPINFSFTILLFLAGMSVAGALSSLFLPETLHQSLPNTIREAENFGKNQNFWQLPKKPKMVPVTVHV
jgi:OCT family organic cation transporter-like MFS transporter 4/5